MTRVTATNLVNQVNPLLLEEQVIKAKITHVSVGSLRKENVSRPKPPKAVKDTHLQTSTEGCIKIKISHSEIDRDCHLF